MGIQRHRAALRKHRWLCRRTFELTLSRPAGFSFSPGQRIRVFRDGDERDYSIVSAQDDGHLTLCIRRVPGGRVTEALARLTTGASVDFAGPFGYLSWRPADRPTVFVATGTGVAPFVAMLRSGAAGFVLMHGVRDSSELYYASELRRAARIYVPCLSAAGTGAPRGAFAGRVTDYLRAALAPGIYDFLLCGRREMIGEAVGIIDERFVGSRVHTEVYF